MLDEETTMTVLEDLPCAIDLGSWLRKYGASTPDEQLLALGQTIGTWLRCFHDWAMSDTPSAGALRQSVAQNTAMKELKWEVNMGRYHRAPGEFPTLTWEETAVYDEIEREVRTRVFEADQAVVHGDFWPGKCVAVFTLFGRGHAADYCVQHPHQGSASARTGLRSVG